MTDRNQLPQRIGSGVIFDDNLYVPGETLIQCIDLKTGKELWRHRPEGASFWSPVVATAEGKIFTVANPRFTIRVRERRGQPAKVYYAPRNLRALPCSMKNVGVNVVYRPLARFGPLNGDLVAVLF